jgi:hypothetical protein
MESFKKILDSAINVISAVVVRKIARQGGGFKLLFEQINFVEEEENSSFREPTTIYKRIKQY